MCKQGASQKVDVYSDLLSYNARREVPATGTASRRPSELLDDRMGFVIFFEVRFRSFTPTVANPHEG